MRCGSFIAIVRSKIDRHKYCPGVLLALRRFERLEQAHTHKTEPNSMHTKAVQPPRNGYAEAAEGLKVHYEIYGQGEPIVVMAEG